MGRDEFCASVGALATASADAAKRHQVRRENFTVMAHLFAYHRELQRIARHAASRR
jgi:hypothetical protein